MTNLAPTPETSLAPLVARAGEYAALSHAEATLRAYGADWRHFIAWCEAHNVMHLPASHQTVGAYIAELADSGRKTATIQRRLCGISAYHKAIYGPAGGLDPTKHEAVRKAMEGIRRTLGTAQTQKTAILTSDIARILAHIPETGVGLRDRTLILLGFAGAFRRAELVALNVEDVKIGEEGATVTVRSSKTDQTAAGALIGIVRGRTDMCPVSHLERLIEARQSGFLAHLKPADCVIPLFIRAKGEGNGRLSPSAVAEIIKKRAAKAGLDASKLAGHSLRAGFVTQAVLNDVQDQLIMQQSRHKSAVVFQKYVRTGKLFKGNASGKLGL